MMVRKTGVQGLSVAAWAGPWEQDRWVSRGTRSSLVSASYRADRWAGGVELELTG